VKHLQKEKHINEHIKRIDLATLDTTVVFSPSLVFTIMTNIKGMEHLMSAVSTTELEWGINF